MHSSLPATLLFLIASTQALTVPTLNTRATGDRENPSTVNCHPEDGIIPKSVVQDINLKLDKMGSVDNDTPCCPSDQGVDVLCASSAAADGTVYDLSVVAEVPGMKGNPKFCIGSAELANYVADFESNIPGSGCLSTDGNGVDTVWQAVWQDSGLNVLLAVHKK